MQKVLAGQESGGIHPCGIGSHVTSQVILIARSFCVVIAGLFERPCSPSQRTWSPWGPVRPGCFLFFPFLARLLDQLPL